jgi:hypothetical protein
MSSYSGDLTWEAWAGALTNAGNTVLGDIQAAYEWYQKWYALTYGLSMAQIQALPQFAGRSTADIQAMQYGWGVFLDLYNALNNVGALPQANRQGYLVPFLS